MGRVPTVLPSRVETLEGWLYRRNPCGEARCRITLERDSGEIVASETRWG